MDCNHKVTDAADMETKMSLKLLVDMSSNRVLFAEAGKEFVDFLFCLLTLPVGAVVKLLKEHSMVECLGKLYESVEKLSSEYIQPNKDKNLLLSPPTSSLPIDQNYPLLLENDAAKPTNKYYVCDVHDDEDDEDDEDEDDPDYRDGYHGFVSDVAGTPCPFCQKGVTVVIEYVAPVAAAGSSSKGSGGFVMGVVSYTVMDDLVVTPMSTISSISLLNKFSIKDVGALEEKMVEVGIKEGLALLKASLQSNTVLTDVFIEKKVP